MPSKVICILGMHRSGTSTITRTINLLGAYLGHEQDLIPAAPDNPEGFWERTDVVDLHDRILEKFKRTPDIITPLPLGWHRAANLRALKQELRQLIEDNFGQRKFWAWKDPRTCVLLDLWKEVLTDLSMEVNCVFIVRNPLDVAKSLQKRNNIQFQKALGFWLNHNICALESSSNIPTVLLNYDDFVERWEPEMRRITRALNISWPVSDEKYKNEVESFIRPSLRHNKSSIEQLKVLPAPIRDLYDLILGQTGKLHPDASFYESIGKLAREFRTYSSFFDFDMDHLFDRGVYLSNFESNRERTVPALQVAEVKETDVSNTCESDCPKSQDLDPTETLNPSANKRTLLSLIFGKSR